MGYTFTQQERLKSKKTIPWQKIGQYSILLLLVVLFVWLVKSFLDGNFNSIESFQEYIQGFGIFGPIILIFVVFWFFLIRPQQKRQKEHQKMCEALTKGDEIVTIGGLAGRIAEVSEQYVVIEISRVEDNPVTITMQRGAVQTVLPRGTLKSIDK